jgi:hypothetical protein
LHEHIEAAVAKLSGLAKPDSKGRYTRDQGWKLREGEYIQHRFLLGTERAKAELRYLDLGKVWDAVQARWDKAGRKTAKPIWDAATLQIGAAVAKGEKVVAFSRADLLPFVSKCVGEVPVPFAEEVMAYHLDNKAVHTYLMTCNGISTASRSNWPRRSRKAGSGNASKK